MPTFKRKVVEESVKGRMTNSNLGLKQKWLKGKNFPSKIGEQ